MKKEYRNNQRGIKRIIGVIENAWSGIIYGVINEKSITFQYIVDILIIMLGFILNISLFEWLFVVLALGLMLAVEYLNTAIEATVDMVTLEYNALAKIAKDCGGAAELIAVITTTIVVGIIYIPKILVVLGF